MRDEQVWIQTYATGTAHGLSDKEPPKRPLGFAPPKPQIVVASTYKAKRGGS